LKIDTDIRKDHKELDRTCIEHECDLSGCEGNNGGEEVER